MVVRAYHLIASFSYASAGGTERGPINAGEYLLKTIRISYFL
jgi:hypothetical protein